MNDSNGEKKPKIVFTKTTPYKALYVKNLINSKGEKLEARDMMNLCRCGQAKTKPFCDGSHYATGLDEVKKEGRLKDRVIDYKGEKITIHDNRAICSHDQSCVNDLPEVFQRGKRRWIQPDEASIEKIIETIKKCPSGALSYTLNGVHHDTQDREPAIKIAKDGPLEIVGGIELEDDAGSVPQSPEHYVLCRCGESKNKPFCDGSHIEAGFSDPKN